VYGKKFSIKKPFAGKLGPDIVFKYLNGFCLLSMLGNSIPTTHTEGQLPKFRDYINAAAPHIREYGQIFLIVFDFQVE
jgi:hypothetical protein